MSEIQQDALPTAPEWLEAAVADELANTIALRRHFHAEPELGNQETKTRDHIAAELRKYGVDEVVTGFGEAHTAVIGVLNPGKGHAVGLRADIDALPVKENTGLPFASCARGTMWGRETDVSHMCGHDMHIAMLLSAARILAAHKEDVPRTVVFVFQPAEEGDSIENPFERETRKLSGGRALVEGGLIEQYGIEEMFGIHVMARVPTGTMQIVPGTALNSIDTFEIEIEGVQAHGAMPWTGVDATLVAAETVIALQQLVARNIDLTRGMGVITIGKLVAGETANVMAGKASMLGTMRTNDMAIRERMLERLPQVVEGTALASGAKASVRIADSYPVTVNNAELARESIQVLRRFGVDAVEIEKGVGASEDFSYYAQKVPSVYMFLGTDPEGVVNAPNNHSDMFNPDESAMAAGVRAHIASVMRPVVTKA